VDRFQRATHDLDCAVARACFLSLGFLSEEPASDPDQAQAELDEYYEGRFRG